MKAHFDFKVSGLIIAMLVVGMFAGVMGSFVAGVNEEYGLDGTNTLSEYDQYDDLNTELENIRDATDIEQEEGILDVIGGYFSAGYSALKTSLSTVTLFGNLLDTASEDVEAFAIFKAYLMAIILIGIFIGVVIAALVKMRI